MTTLYGHDVWSGFVASSQPADVQGWNGIHPSLSRLAGAPGEKIVIDVGVWKGQSTITMARAMQEAGIDGCVIAIDTFLGSREHWDGPDAQFRRVHGRPDLYETFMSNVQRAGVARYVVPLAQTSVTAAAILRKLDITAAVIHVDAAHEYEEVLRDCEEYWNILNRDGYLIGDDYAWPWPGVVRAAGEFSARQQLPLTIEYPKWILCKDH